MGKGNRSRLKRRQEANDFHLTPMQEKVMQKEINAQILENDKRYWLDMDAAVMWALHEEYGFGEKRLRRFFDRFSKIHTDLRNYYQLEDSTNTWLCRHLLKDKVGIDIEAWEKEYETNNAE